MENNRFSYAAGCQRSLRNYPGDHAKKADLFASSSPSLSWRLCAFLRCWSGYILDHAHHRRNESHSRSLKPGVVHHIHVYTNCAGEKRGGVNLLRTCSAHRAIHAQDKRNEQLRKSCRGKQFQAKPRVMCRTSKHKIHRVGGSWLTRRLQEHTPHKQRVCRKIEDIPLSMIWTLACGGTPPAEAGGVYTSLSALCSNLNSPFPASRLI